jgi:hypothetical protein
VFAANADVYASRVRVGVSISIEYKTFLIAYRPTSTYMDLEIDPVVSRAWLAYSYRSF